MVTPTSTTPCTTEYVREIFPQPVLEMTPLTLTIWDTPEFRVMPPQTAPPPIGGKGRTRTGLVVALRRVASAAKRRGWLLVSAMMVVARK